MKVFQLLLVIISVPFLTLAQNTTITSYYQVRNILEEVIYQSDDERITLYYQVQFDEV